MKTASNDVIDALQNYADLKFAEIYTFTLADNSTYLYTSLDVNIVIGSNEYKSDGLLIKRGPMRQGLGLQVDDLEITVYPTTANIGGVGWLAALRNGALDGATVLLQRVFFKWWAADGFIGAITLFNGNVSDIDPIGRAGAVLKVASIAELLSVMWPRMVYSAQCVWRLYDAGCTANRTSFTVSGNVTGNGTVNSFPTGLAQANNYFDQGVVRFTAGNNIDVMRTIKSYSAGNVSIPYPLLYAPAANDAFQIYPGCDHSQNTCIFKFSNGNNFRGFPFIPVPEAGL
jgi:uncharacterized phage protein (TIGR02218 family)